MNNVIILLTAGILIYTTDRSARENGKIKKSVPAAVATVLIMIAAFGFIAVGGGRSQIFTILVPGLSGVAIALGLYYKRKQ